MPPITHFKGRRALLASLEDWLAEPSPTTHVVSLIAVGGAGKTAIVERLVAGLCHARFAGGLFVWSFYENSTSGQPRLVLAGTHLAAWLAHATGDRATALHEASRGAELADACGFGLLAIDFRVLWARCLVAAGDVARADRLIDEAIERASDPRCDYRWGAADAWHQRALCRRDTDPIAARLAAEEALRLRDALRHPDVAASSVLLDELSAPPRDAPRDTDRQDAVTDPCEIVPS